MLAAMLRTPDGPLEIEERTDPRADEGTLLETRAAPLNPIDLSIAAGRFFAGRPPMPYVPGIEAVASVVDSKRLAAGARVFASGDGLGVTRDGTLAERFTAPEEALIEVPEGVDDPIAAALGTAGLAAWMPLAWRSPVGEDESVLVLGATGTVGLLAVQVAKLLGASRVVAVGRDTGRLERASRLGADAVVPLGEDFAERLRLVVAPRPPTLILDMLWGDALEASVKIAARGARIINVGQAPEADAQDAPTAAVSSADLRAKRLELIGWSNYAAPPARLAEGYRDLLGHAAAGRVEIELETIPLADADKAWQRFAAGGAPKLVIVP
jgi:NADPH2:quinone reductase